LPPLEDQPDSGHAALAVIACKNAMRLTWFDELSAAVFEERFRVPPRRKPRCSVRQLKEVNHAQSESRRVRKCAAR
jgi:hypothetical protein